MDPEPSRTMEMAALGRPFSLGMLYDCRQDSLIPGMTLWNTSDLEKHTRERPKPSSEFEIVASESIEDKSSALKVEASLKASFLGGLVEVEGSAKYLNDHKTSRNQARVTLKYETTTKFQELSMDHLGGGNVKHPYVFEKGIATHVVTAILYGAQAFFVFDRETSEKEDCQDVQGNLKVMIKKIPCITVEGEGSLNMEDKDKANVEKFSCKFHGDFSLEKNPVSFQDAVQVYQSLPKLLGSNGEKAVPVKVWLLPLTCLDSSAAQLVRQISVRLVQEAQTVLEDLSELEMRSNDAMRTAKHFPQIKKKLKSFKEVCSVFKLEFQQTLSVKLPSIRGGGEDEGVLAELLMKRHSSPFNSKNLAEWMDCKEREISILSSYTRMMKNSKISSPNSLHEEILSTNYAVCFVFTSLGDAEPYLSTLSNYLKGTANPVNPQDPYTYDVEKEQWYLSNKVPDDMRTKAKLFTDFSESNKENKNIKFLIMSLTNETQKGSSIYLYKDGVSLRENYEPPSKPDTVKASEINHDSVTLKICPPRFGAEDITSYCVEYCAHGEDGWQQKTAPVNGDVTVSGLSPNTEYVFRCRAVTSVGVGPVSEVSGTIETLPCSPPGKPQVEPNSSEISVSWQRPAELGQDVQVLSYIVEYAQAGNVSTGADVQWNQTMSGAEKATISELLSETEYIIRVRCDCGVAGRSKESISVNVSTTKREFARLAEYLKHMSRSRGCESPSLYKLSLKEEDIDVEGCRRFNLGKETLRQNRTIMLLGATGSGKSTLINGITNYIVGVEWKDDFRFQLVAENQSRSQAESQTSEVTVYKLNYQEGFRIPFSLTVVDTPGFGDTRGVGRDKEITEQIRKLFSSVDGVSEIDAVCFVTQASLARLTATQQYVFDSVLSIFGKDVADNIKMLVTFADGKQPPVLEAINASGVPCPKNDLGLPVHFKFNNSALFADNRCHSDCACDEDSEDEDDHNFDEMFWNMGARSMERFFTALGKMTTKSLQMTQEVLKERKHLETAVEGLQPQVKAGLAMIEEIKKTRETIKEHETVMTSNENFEIEIDVIKAIKKPLTKGGNFITNCQKCSITCHYPCAIADDNRKSTCSAMDPAGMCTVCPGKCIWSIHFNQTYSWEYVNVKQKQTLQDIKDKYEKATQEKLTVQELIEKQEEEIDHLQDIIMSLMDQTAHCLTRLQEISLRPNPLTTPDYIDMLIQGEKSEAKEGYQARIKSLETIKDRAKIISKVARREKLNKTDDQLSKERQQTKEKIGYFRKCLNFFSFKSA